MNKYNEKIPIVAFERKGSIVYSCLKEVCDTYGIRYKESLKRLIDNGGVGPDGYTTFDYLFENEVKKNCI